MGIGTSDGAYYDDDFHYAAAQHDPEKYETNKLTRVYIDTSEKKYDTELTPEEENVYINRYGPDASNDYDMRGYFKANPDVLPNTEGVHYPDTFKKPNHPTFSDQSMYSTGDTIGGSWSQDNGMDVFTPSEYNLKNMSREELQDYFNKVEPGVRLNLPSKFDIDTSRMPFGSTGPAEGPSLLGEFLAKKGKEYIQPFLNFAKAIGEKNIDPSSDEGVKLATDMAMSMVGTPAPKPANSLGSFAGIQALEKLPAIERGKQLSNLAHAQVLEANKVHPDKIWEKTGWEKSKDGNWKFEIADNKSKYHSDWFENEFSKSDGSWLGNILQHDELYKHYKFLRDIPVKYDPKLVGASWNGREITLGGGKWHDGHISAESKSDLMHEVQHIIQEYEGFAAGGGPLNYLGDTRQYGALGKLKFSDEINNLREEAQNLLMRRELGILSTFGEDRIKEILPILKKAHEYMEAGTQEAYKNYARLVGEVEARNTQARLDMTKSQRKAIPPKYTEDVPREDQRAIFDPSLGTAYGNITQHGKLIK